MTQAPASSSIARADEKPSTKPGKKRVDHNESWDTPDDAAIEPRHHADEVRDQGMFESFGRAITAPVLPVPTAAAEKPKNP